MIHGLFRMLYKLQQVMYQMCNANGGKRLRLTYSFIVNPVAFHHNSHNTVRQIVVLYMHKTYPATTSLTRHTVSNIAIPLSSPEIHGDLWPCQVNIYFVTKKKIILTACMCYVF